MASAQAGISSPGTPSATIPQNPNARPKAANLGLLTVCYMGMCLGSEGRTPSVQTKFDPVEILFTGVQGEPGGGCAEQQEEGTPSDGPAANASSAGPAGACS